MNITFFLLGLSICSVWLPSVQYGKRKIAAWIPIFVFAIGSGLFFDILKPITIIELGILTTFSCFASNSNNKKWPCIIFSILTALVSLALAMHFLPGFRNPVLISHIKFSNDASPYTQYLNFDKAAVGLILLSLLCAHAHTVTDWRIVLRRTYPIAIITIITVISTALLSGYVRPEFKISSYTLIFLATNLLFTCVAEEAFFRGFLQDRLAKGLTRFRHGNTIAIMCSGALFGLVHIGGGMSYVLLASLVGFGSAYAYSIVKRIEAPIITHFGLNAVHFVFFTYPHLQ